MSHHINSSYWTCLIADSMCMRSSVARSWVQCYCVGGTWSAYKKHRIEDKDIIVELQHLIRKDRISDKSVPPPTFCTFHNSNVLDLSDSNLQDAGVQLVADWIVESNVKELNLESNLITDSGAYALYNKLKKHSRDIHINLNHNLITADGAALLHKIQNATFTFSGNCISPLTITKSTLPDWYFKNQDIFKLPQVLYSCQMAYEISEEEAPIYIDHVYGSGTFCSFLENYINKSIIL